MHSVYQRINGISALLSSSLLALLAAIALSSLAIQATRQPVVGTLEVASINVYESPTDRFSSKKQELAWFTFSYEADLSPLFDWNTKQIFLYLSAEYTNAQGVKNDVVLWDRIVRRKQDAKINIKGVKNKYRFRELSPSFRNVSPANLTLKYNIMPHVGLLTYGEAGCASNAIRFPRAVKQVLTCDL